MGRKLYVVDGGDNISADDLSRMLAKRFPAKTVIVIDEIHGVPKDDCIFVVEELVDKGNETEELRSEIASQKKDIAAMEVSMSKAFAYIQSTQNESKEFSLEMAHLKKKVEMQKQQLVHILWNHCAPYHPLTRHIPPVEDANTYVDSLSQVGKDYSVGDLLGQGQYASVTECTRLRDRRSLALKAIDKSQVLNFQALSRISTEVEILKKLSSRYVVSMLEVIQTSARVYIVMEKGGLDMFNLIGRYPTGMPDEWAKQIISFLVKALEHIHLNGICHRDVKPENVLMNFDADAGRCLDLKLCDFGLSSKYLHNVPLKDFCGSPGFFDPEMVIEGEHYGDKADLWSLGAIMLELILGHNLFSDHWMTSYTPNVIKNKSLFTSSIQQSVRNLPSILNFTPECNDFILKTMVTSSNKRMTTQAMTEHSWLAGLCQERITPITDRISSNVCNSSTGKALTPEVAVSEGEISAPPIKIAYSKQPSPKTVALFEVSRKGKRGL